MLRLPLHTQANRKLGMKMLEIFECVLLSNLNCYPFTVVLSACVCVCVCVCACICSRRVWEHLEASFHLVLGVVLCHTSR